MTTPLAQYNCIHFKKVIYPRDGICPLLFHAGKFELFSFSDITNSLIHTNRLSFMSIKDMRIQTQLKSMSKVFHVIFQVYYESMNEIMLSSKLFYNVAYIKFEGILNEVENEGVFLNNYKNLFILTLSLSNMEEFIHKGTQWMNSLNGQNPYFNVDIDSTTLMDLHDIKNQLISIRFVYKKSTATFDSIYTYPDEDFCLFKSFPHTRLVMPIIIPGVQLECTCTLKYLQMYLQRVYSPNFVNISNEYKEDEYEEDKSLILNRIPTTFLFCSTVISFQF